MKKYFIFLLFFVAYQFAYGQYTIISPTSSNPIDVKTNGSYYGKFLTTSSNYAILKFYTNTTDYSGYLNANYSGDMYFGVANYTSKLHLATYGGTGRLTILPNGNVGIGQTTPVAKLEVTGVNATENTFTLPSGSNLTTVIGINDINTTNQGDNKAGVLASVNGGTNGNFCLWGETNASGTGIFNIGIYGFDRKGGANDYAGYFVGKVFVAGTLTTSGPKPFTIDHPLDPENKTLHHFAIESPEVLNSYSGNATTDGTGKVVVALPDYFEAINKDFRYQLTVIGSFAQSIISKEITKNQFEISTSQPNTKVSWEVKGIRNDGYMKYVNTMTAVEDKTPAEKGKYFTPKAFNLPESKGTLYMEKSTITATTVEQKVSVAGTSADPTVKKEPTPAPSPTNVGEPIKKQ